MNGWATIRDIAITIAAVLVIISMVHYDKHGAGFYLGLPISNDKNAIARYINDEGRKGFMVQTRDGKITIKNGVSITGWVDTYHKNSCVNGYSFGR